MTENPPSTSGRERRVAATWARLRGLPGLLQPRGSLWSNPAFLRIWLANTIDDFGTHITALAIPLTAAITLGAGPVQMGVLAAMHWLPYFALGLFAGVLVDRRPRQQLMVLVNWLRAGVLALIPLAALVGLLRIELLFVVAVLAGACGIVFDVAYVSWLPSLVARKELHDANGKMEATYASAQAAGPGIAGVLVGLVSAPFAIAVDAASFAVSATLIRGIRPARPEESEQTMAAFAGKGESGRARSIFRDIRAGLGAVWRDPYIRAMTSCSGLVSLFGYAFLAVYILFMTDVLHLSPIAIGAILGAGGIGAVIGAASAVPVSRRLGFGRGLIWAQIIFAVMGVTVPIAVFVPTLAVPMLALSEFAQYGALAVYNVGQLSLRQARTAPELQGRVSASVRSVVSGAALGGSLLGGVLGGWIGLGETLVVGVVGMALACILVIASPLRTLRELPEN